MDPLGPCKDSEEDARVSHKLKGIPRTIHAAAVERAAAERICEMQENQPPVNKSKKKKRVEKPVVTFSEPLEMPSVSSAGRKLNDLRVNAVHLISESWEDPNAPLLRGFEIHLDVNEVFPARMRRFISVTLKVPENVTLAPKYIAEGSPSADAQGLLVQKRLVLEGELSHWIVEVANSSPNPVNVASGFHLLDVERAWMPRDLPRKIDEDEVRDVPEDQPFSHRVDLIEKQAAREMSHVAKTYGHCPDWRGERYDPGIDAHVAELVHELGLDALLFNEAEDHELKKKAVVDMIMAHCDVFAKDSLCPGRSDLEAMPIPLKDPNQRPIRSSPYRTAPLYRDFVAEQIEKLLVAGSLKHGKGPWASPIAVVRHPSGKLRMVCDYRRVNQATKLDAHPLPDLEAILQQLGEMKYFSAVDLCSGYHQIALEENSRERSAITTHLGLFEWQVVPFGLGGAPSHFSRCMNALLSGMNYRNAIAFIDDVLIYSKTFKQHLADLTEFFLQCRKFHVSLKPSKCSFFAQSATYLGFTLSRHGLDTVTAKVEAINKIPPPQTLTQLRSFVQMVNFYRRFCKNLSVVAKPLTDLTRKEAGNFKAWEKGSAADKAFIEVKRVLTTAPLLRHPRPDLPFQLEVDASKSGYS